MKKRLLSAALALAMVLTLLPMTVFAAASGDAVRYQTSKQANAEYSNAGATFPGWFTGNGTTASPYVEATGGFAVGNRWYSSFNDIPEASRGTGTIAVVGSSETIPLINLTSNMTIDLYGQDLTITTLNLATTCNGATLTVQDSNTTTAATHAKTLTVTNAIQPGTVTTTGAGKNFGLTLKNVGFEGIINATHSSASVVSLDNSTFTGNVTYRGQKATNATVDSTSGARVVLTNKSTLTGNVSITQATGAKGSTNSTVSLTGGSSITGTDGNVTVEGKGSGVYAANSNIGGVITLKGSATQLDNISSTMGSVQVTGPATVLDTEKNSVTAATLNISGNGAVVTDIIKVAGTTDPLEALNKGVTVNIKNDARVTGAVNLPTAAITVDGGKVGGQTTLGLGTLTLGSANASMNTNMDAIVLGSAGTGAVTVNIPQNTNASVTTGAISEATGNAKTITLNIPESNKNNFASVTMTTPAKWAANTIKGGNFGTAITASQLTDYQKSVLDQYLLYEVTDTANTGYPVSYWKGSDIDALVAKYANGTTTVKAVGTAATGGKTLTLEVNQPATTPNGITNNPATGTPSPVTVLEVTFDATNGFQLPLYINRNKVNEWIPDNTTRNAYGFLTPLPGGSSVTLGTSVNAKFTADSLSYMVTKVNNVGVNTAMNPTITATMNGNNVITLSGAATRWSGNTATIGLKLYTDAGTVDVNVSWIPTSTGNKLIFQSVADTSGSMVLMDAYTSLVLTVNNTKYTLSDGGLREQAANLTLDGNTGTTGDVITTINIPENVMNKPARDALAKAMSYNDVVNFSQSPAVLEKYGALIAPITGTQVTNWLNTVRGQAFRANPANKGISNPSPTQLMSTGYNTVAAVLYLDVKVTNYSSAGGVSGTGMLTATLTPMMRVEVRNDSPDETKDWLKTYVVQAGRSLGALTGEMGSVEVNLPVESNFVIGAHTAATATTPVAYSQFVHQNGTYVYGVEGIAAVNPAPKMAKFTLTHAANTGDGFGTVIFNTTKAPISITTGTGASAVTRMFNTIQAAVDDAKNGETVVVGDGITGEFPINVTGDARTFNIDVTGNATVSRGTSANGVIITENAGSQHTYTVQLTKDTAIVKNNVEIAVAATQNGAANLSASSAKAGDVITIVTVPNQGYKVNTITAATNTGAAVAVSATGTLNQYTLTVPANTTKVTVTPTFVVGDNKATFSVNSNTRGTASVYTGTSDGKVEQGKSATVTVIPTSGNRTMGLTAYGNNGATAPVSRTGTNSFNVTVPSGATTVTVTPSFDVDNGTPFSDVLSNHWASNEISWAYRHGYTSGKDTAYTYKPADYITRGEVVAMLWKAANSPVVNYANPFKDVPTNYWAYNAVMWAASKGLIDTSTGYFNGTGYINRADTVVILYKHANSPTVYGTSGFADVASNAYYSRAVTWARQQGLTNGYSGNTYFRPSYAISRAEVATFLYRAFG